MKKTSRNSPPFLTLLLVMTTATIADDGSPSDSDRRLNDILETYNKACLNAGFMAQLEILIKPNTIGSLKRCDPNVLQNKVRSLLSDTVDSRVSDSVYREWYEHSNRLLRSTANQNTSYPTSLQFQDITKQSIRENIVKGTETRDKPVLSTVQGYQTLDGK